MLNLTPDHCNQQIWQRVGQDSAVSGLSQMPAQQDRAYLGLVGHKFGAEIGIILPPNGLKGAQNRWQLIGLFGKKIIFLKCPQKEEENVDFF